MAVCWGAQALEVGRTLGRPLALSGRYPHRGFGLSPLGAAQLSCCLLAFGSAGF